MKSRSHWKEFELATGSSLTAAAESTVQRSARAYGVSFVGSTCERTIDQVTANCNVGGAVTYHFFEVDLPATIEFEDPFVVLPQ